MSDVKLSAFGKSDEASGKMKPKKAGKVTYASPEDHLSGGSYLRVDEDEMAAWLYLTPPEKGKYYSKGDLIRFIQNGGIKTGLQDSNLSAIIEKRVYNREILAARGREVINGEDGYYEDLLLTENGALGIKEYGTADNTYMGAIENMYERDKFTVYRPATQGVDGYTVYGVEIKAKSGKELQSARGESVLQENNEYYSRTDGKTETREGKTDIQAVNVHAIPNVASVVIKPKKAGNISYAGSEDHLADGTYLRVEKDAMTAWLYLAPPEEEQYYSKGDLIRFLQNRGINSGLHSSNLSAIINKKVYNREIVVARGRDIVVGRDGYYEYLFKTKRSTPEIREDGTVDYTNMSALENVHEGDKVAIYHPAVQGIDGYTVYGAVVKARSGKELPLARGKGVQVENNEYYALVDGKIQAKGGKIDIQRVHEIRGDVTLIIGKVEFLGDVIVNGNVESGVTITAGRNIEVRGTTGNAILSAGGDVLLSRGIQGGGKISAKGNVYADFIENTMVEAEGVIQSNTILNAQVYSKERVITTGKKGCIIGGYAHGYMGIRAMTVGNDAEVRTILHCGYELEDYERLLDLKHQEADVKEKLEELTERITKSLQGDFMRGKGASLNPAEWKQMKETYLKQLEDISMERERMEEIVEESKGASIRVDGDIHRNVIISVNAEQMMVNNEARSMRYGAEKGAIEASVL